MLVLAVDILALAYNLRCDSDVAKITCIYKACHSSWKNVPLVMRFGAYVKDALVVCVESSCTLQARTGNNGASCPWSNNLEIVWPTTLEDLGREGQCEYPSTYHVVHPYHGQGITMHSSSTFENLGNINEPSLSSVSRTFT
jgi:hypothetical protein